VNPRVNSRAAIENSENITNKIFKIKNRCTIILFRTIKANTNQRKKKNPAGMVLHLSSRN
jgi:hypothetical protein